MSPNDLDDLAMRWWAQIGKQEWEDSDTAADEVREMLDTYPNMLPVLVRSLVNHARTPFGVPYIGTSIIEDLGYSERSAVAFDALRSAQLEADTLVALLSGVYPSGLSAWEVGVHLKDLLTPKQIDWLTDPLRREGL